MLISRLGSAGGYQRPIIPACHNALIIGSREPEGIIIVIWVKYFQNEIIIECCCKSLIRNRKQKGVLDVFLHTTLPYFEIE